MSALRNLTGDAGVPPASRGSTPLAAPRKRTWLPRRELLGVDVGSSLIKAVLLSERHGSVLLKRAVLGPTPPGAVTAGELTDSIKVAESLRKLCKENHLGARHVAAAVSGEKVYTQFEALPREFEEDLETFVHDAMMKVIPYPCDGAAFDYERLPGDGSSAGVLWVSSATEQVEWVREAMTLAGKVPAIVDAQACAVANTYTFNYQPASEDVAVLVHVGPRRMTVALLRGATLLWSRDATLCRDPGSAPEAVPALAGRELDSRWDLLLQQASPHKPSRVYLSGGAAQSEQMREIVNDCTGLPVDELKPFWRISYSPETAPGRIAEEYGTTLSVAVGLALRGLEEL